MARELVNLTQHAINFIDANNEVFLTVEPSGSVARVSVRTEVVGSLGAIPITQSVFGEVEGLPAQEAGKVFLVSSLVAQRVPDRTDVFIPNESVRDDQGRIIGCRSLGRI